jgi:hypothetical protein
MARAVKWTTKLAALQDYKEKNGDALVPQNHLDESSGFKLGRWVDNLRSGHVNLSDAQRNDLDKLDFVWKISEVKPWETKLTALQGYKEKNGDTLAPQRYVDESSGFKLGRWVNDLRQRKLQLSNAQQNDLDRIGFVWAPKIGRRPKPLDAAAAATKAATKVARKKKGATSCCSKGSSSAKSQGSSKSLQAKTRQRKLEEKSKPLNTEEQNLEKTSQEVHQTMVASESNQSQENAAASITAAATTVTSRSNNSRLTRGVIEHKNNTDDKDDDDDNRASTGGTWSNKELRSITFSTSTEKQVASRLLELNATIKFSGPS